MSGLDYTQHLDEWGRPHADEDCWQCAGCDDWACKHSEAGECQRIGCECMALVTGDDPLMLSQPCRMCAGAGEIAVEPVPADPQLLVLTCCPTCWGNGLHHPVEDIAS